MSNKVLVVDDEKSIMNIIAYNLKKEGFQVVCAEDGEMALDMFEKENPDLILLDIMMPKIDGYGVCKRIRSFSDVPIIMLTARADEVDKVLGFDIGADDYVTKPFSNRELMARVKRNIRRNSKEVPCNNSLNYGDLSISIERMEITKRGELLNLTVREFELFKFLILNKEQIFTREDLLSKVWGYEYFGDLRAVDVTIRRLREKIEDDSSKPKFILTKRGVGYYFGE